MRYSSFADQISRLHRPPTRPEEELYDLETDPFEVENLANDPGHRETLERMRAELARWIEETDDQGRFAEPAEVIQYWEEQMHEVYGDPPAAAR